MIFSLLIDTNMSQTGTGRIEDLRFLNARPLIDCCSVKSALSVNDIRPLPLTSNPSILSSLMPRYVLLYTFIGRYVWPRIAAEVYLAVLSFHKTVLGL